MLADLIQELKPRLVGRVAALADGGAEGLPALAGELIAALRRGRADVTPCRSHLRLGVDTEKLLSLVRLLKDCVYDVLAERGVTAPLQDLRVLAEWFAAIQELALREDKRRLTALLDGIPDHVALHDRDGRVLYANHAARDDGRAMIGGEMILGRTLAEYGVPDSFVRQADADAARAFAGETVRSELRLAAPKGWRWREQIVGPVFATDGSVEGVAFASRDIHARKLAEARLRLLSKVGTLAETMEYEGVLSATARLSIPDLADWCVIDVVEDGKLGFRNVAHAHPDQAAQTEKLLQDQPLLLDPASDGQTWERVLGASSVLVVPFVVLGKTVAVGRFVRMPESGLVHGPEDRALAEEVARRAGQIIENARLHQQLRQSEARFRLALEHANVVVFEEDADFRVRWTYNPQLAGGPNAVLGGEDTAKVSALKRHVLETGESVRTEVDPILDGVRRHVLVNYEPLRAASGAIVGIMGAGIDVTKEKKAQEELSEALGFREQMLGVLGHDLRNPLGAVRGLAGLLQLHDGVPEKVREGLGRIDQSSRRMSEMIDTLLDFTHARFRGTLPIVRESVDLVDVSRRVVEELRVAAPAREIRVDAKLEVLGSWDAARMAQVISNLVANALEHGAADARVEVSIFAEGADAILAVTNRGPAIPPEQLDRLFEPFRRGDSGANGTPSRGLGLGLYIVREIVVAHGGTITVRSTDASTTFSVRLRR